MARCFDCLTEFAPDDERFAVLKKMREFKPDVDPEEARRYDSLLYDQVFICGDCAGWYGDHPIRVTAAEAGHI